MRQKKFRRPRLQNFGDEKICRDGKFCGDEKFYGGGDFGIEFSPPLGQGAQTLNPLDNLAQLCVPLGHLTQYPLNKPHSVVTPWTHAVVQCVYPLGHTPLDKTAVRVRRGYIL